MKNLRSNRIAKPIVFVLTALLILGTFFSTLTFIPPPQKAYAVGNTYYVKTGGNDAANGLSDANAWATLAKVRSSLGGTIHAGDTVVLNRGDTFAGYIQDNAVISGTAGNPITFDAYGTGAAPIINAAGNARGIDIRGVNYLTFQNLQIINATSVGFLLYTGLDHIIIDNVTVSAVPTAINVGTGTFSNITLSNSVFSGGTAGLSGAAGTTYTTWTITNSTFNGSSGSGVYLNSSVAVTDLSISDSQFNNNGGIGFYIGMATGLSVIDSSFSNNGGAGITASSLVDTTLSGLTMDSNVAGDGLRIQGSGSSNISVINSTFRYNSPASKSYNGVTLTAGSGSNITFTNCISEQNGGDGFNVHNDWTNVIIDHCTSENNGIDGATTDGDGFSFHENSTGTIRYSIAKNNKKSAVLHVGHTQVTHYNNLFYNTTNGTQPLASFMLPDTNASFILYNNVIWSGGATGTVVGLGGTSITKNNIIVGGNYGIVKAVGSTVTEDYNLVYGAATANFSGLTAGAHDVQLDPQLVNPPTDFHLQSTSPAIDAGVDLNINTDYAGKQRYDVPGVTNTGSVGAYTKNYVDIGAYEYVTAPDPMLTSTACPSQTTYCYDPTPDITVTNTSATTNYNYLVNQTLAPLKADVEAGTADADGAFTVPSGVIPNATHATYYIHVIAQNLDGDFSDNYSTYKIIHRDRSSGVPEETVETATEEPLPTTEEVIEDVILTAQNLVAKQETVKQEEEAKEDQTVKQVEAKPAPPTITNIRSQGEDILIEGSAASSATVYITIHSDPFNTQATANAQGKWTYLLKKAIKTIGEGDHTIFVTSSVKAADGTELTSDQSKTYDFKLSVDNEKLKVEMKKTKTWQIVAVVFSLLFLLTMVFLALKRRRAQNY